jgi:hypothetical protein
MANLLDIYFEIFQLTNEMSEMKGRLLLLNSIRHPNLILSYNITLFKCTTTCIDSTLYARMHLYHMILFIYHIILPCII